MHFDFSPTSPTLWVFIAVILFFIILAYFGVSKMIGSALDKRADKIKSELDEARRLREEAQALLASYQRKQKEAEEQAAEIVKQAKRDAEIMAEQARTQLHDRLERRAVMAEAKIATAETEAVREVKNRASDIAMQATQKLIESKLGPAEQSGLIEKGIANLGKAAH